MDLLTTHTTMDRLFLLTFLLFWTTQAEVLQLYQDTTWTLANSPIVSITDSARVDQQATLTVGAGVTVEITGEMSVFGNIQLLGTPEQPVILRQSPDSSSSRGFTLMSLYLFPGTVVEDSNAAAEELPTFVSGSIFQNVIIDGLSEGMTINYGEPYLHNVTFRNCGQEVKGPYISVGLNDESTFVMSSVDFDPSTCPRTYGTDEWDETRQLSIGGFDQGGQQVWIHNVQNLGWSSVRNCQWLRIRNCSFYDRRLELSGVRNLEMKDSLLYESPLEVRLYNSDDDNNGEMALLLEGNRFEGNALYVSQLASLRAGSHQARMILRNNTFESKGSVQQTLQISMSNTNDDSQEDALVMEGNQFRGEISIGPLVEFSSVAGRVRIEENVFAGLTRSGEDNGRGGVTIISIWQPWSNHSGIHRNVFDLEGATFVVQVNTPPVIVNLATNYWRWPECIEDQIKYETNGTLVEYEPILIDPPIDYNVSNSTTIPPCWSEAPSMAPSSALSTTSSASPDLQSSSASPDPRTIFVEMSVLLLHIW